LAQALEQFERTTLHRVLLRNQWNLVRAAAELDMTPEAIQARIKTLHITLNE
jgi:transcriptional regulator with GAF, ATPase, and Fis domain